MALNKNVLNINFSGGLDRKTDPWQVSPNMFLNLTNSVFDTGGRLSKRNGFGQIGTLPDISAICASTFQGGLVALGNSLEAYSAANSTWYNQGSYFPCELSTLPVVRNEKIIVTQLSCLAPNGILFVGYYDLNGIWYYNLIDSATGAILKEVNTSSNAILAAVYFNNQFHILLASGSAVELLQINPTTFAVTTTGSFLTDYYYSASYNPLMLTATVYNNELHVAYTSGTTPTTIHVYAINTSLTASSVLNYSYTGTVAYPLSLSGDPTDADPTVYLVAGVDAASAYNIYASCYHFVSGNPTSLVAPALVDNTYNTLGMLRQNVSGAAYNSQVEIIYNGVPQSYAPAPGTTPLYPVKSAKLTKTGTLTNGAVSLIPSAYMASPLVCIAGTYYFVAMNSVATTSSLPTFFLCSFTNDQLPVRVISRFAYTNASMGTFLPSVNTIATGWGVSISSTSSTEIKITYLFKALIESANTSVTATGLYETNGIDFAVFNLAPSTISTVELGDNLNISGGFLWSYDGLAPTEQNFFLGPDIIAVATTTGTNLPADTYTYIATYEWTDNQGNVHKSVPSLPASLTIASGTNAATITVPCLMFTYKGSVRIVIYRYSVSQPIYYQVTSITGPTLNDPAHPTVTFTDTNTNAKISGNPILYTTGGVVEDAGAPASSILASYKARLFLVDAEDTNLLWYSKQTIEATPVEMSDQLTWFVPPTVGNSNAGGITGLAVMDDKLILFKKNYIYYMTGTGPDNTGANNDFSDPQFIASSVGCTNSRSIVLMPNGLMFQSDKGIWLLNRNLETSYIGAPIEAYNSNNVVSALSIPNTNQIRFMLDNGVALVYDYYYNQWGTFSNINSVSSTIFNDLHTFVDTSGRVLQETVGTYLDITTPVNMSFTTAWINLAGLQGFERAYFLNLIGKYLSAHTLSVGLAYDYNSTIVQTSVITPDSTQTLEQWRVFPQTQKCESFQVTVTESDSTGGAGLTLSGLNVVIGAKKGYPKLKPSYSVG